jgi:hypothetical protein
MNIEDPITCAAFFKSHERMIIFLLGCLAAVHVFIFPATFPFFNNVDEQAHFDLVIKYSHGQFPRHLDFLSHESLQYIAIYNSQEFLASEEDFPGRKMPPPIWLLPPDKIAPVLKYREAGWQNINHEAAQPPLYYTIAALWWHVGKWLGLDGGRILYWIRFLNIFFVVMLVWLGWVAAQMVFPENLFLRIGVPALITFIPQTTFYSIQNDVLSPLCFGAAFILLVQFFRAGVPGPKLGVATGLVLAATFLTKISNLPLLAVSAAIMLLKIFQLGKAGKLRAAMPSILTLALCAGLPMAAWLAWCKYNFGDFTGTVAKIQFLGWTHQPFAEWRHHPIFTLSGFWIFIHDLLSTFWQGEILWHRQPLALPAIDMVYVLLTFILIGVALVNLLLKSKIATRPQCDALWFALACFVAVIAFSGFLSIIYDFHDCFYPSREHPYFTSGRLMLGALIPFLLLFVYGIDRGLKNFSNPTKFLVLAAMILCMLASEIAVDWPVFSSQYNWFHM